MKPIDILLVEDNPADIELTRESLESSRLHLQLHVASDGVQAMAFLRREGKHAAAPRPDLILLDLNLPRLSGREVLEQLRADAALRRIPVIVLSTSDADDDVATSYDLGANCYIRKPLDFEQFQQIVRSIEGYWLTIVKLPPE